MLWEPLMLCEPWDRAMLWARLRLEFVESFRPPMAWRLGGASASRWSCAISLMGDGERRLAELACAALARGSVGAASGKCSAWFPPICDRMLLPMVKADDELLRPRANGSFRRLAFFAGDPSPVLSMFVGSCSVSWLSDGLASGKGENSCVSRSRFGVSEKARFGAPLVGGDGSYICMLGCCWNDCARGMAGCVASSALV
mmetsp:Transcript_44684/g.140116  ORF Transcript_44684/g.140116 Transcript_44684/m.140116 type:complete len:200 (+) Transcript_44684:1903-2502(+)